MYRPYADKLGTAYLTVIGASAQTVVSGTLTSMFLANSPRITVRMAVLVRPQPAAVVSSDGI